MSSPRPYAPAWRRFWNVRLLLLAPFALLCGYHSLGAAPDKSGVKPSAISLPSGAGSIEGLGESFEPQLNTGSSSYGVAIAVPPGRAGLQPKVRLAYNSSLGNSFVGLGWSLDLPTIKRQTDKGFPSFTSADTFVFGGEELVPLSNPQGDWRCENEGAFQRFRQIDTDDDFIPDAWEMFQYSSMNLADAHLESLATLPDLDLADADGNTQIADVDGDGLPDIVRTSDDVTRAQLVCLNHGPVSNPVTGRQELQFAGQTVMATSSSFRLSDANSTLTDIDADGLVDFVRILPGDITGKQLEVFANRSRLDRTDTQASGFATSPTRTLFSAPQSISFSNPQVRQMDVNFDKISDFIANEGGMFGHFFYYLRTEAGGWQEIGPVPFSPDMSGFNLAFQLPGGEANPAVHLADMNGDRLQDLVYLETSGSGIGATLTVRYWPYCGLGQWGAMRVMTLSPGDAFQVDALDLRDVLVQDLTGEGLADIAVVHSDGGTSSSLELRVNVAGRHSPLATRHAQLPL
jgi:hypothetical protein